MAVSSSVAAISVRRSHLNELAGLQVERLAGWAALPRPSQRKRLEQRRAGRPTSIDEAAHQEADEAQQPEIAVPELAPVLREVRGLQRLGRLEAPRSPGSAKPQARRRRPRLRLLCPPRASALELASVSRRAAPAATAALVRPRGEATLPSSRCCNRPGSRRGPTRHNGGRPGRRCRVHATASGRCDRVADLVDPARHRVAPARVAKHLRHERHPVDRPRHRRASHGSRPPT